MHFLCTYSEASSGELSHYDYVFPADEAIEPDHLELMLHKVLHKFFDTHPGLSYGEFTWSTLAPGQSEQPYAQAAYEQVAKRDRTSP